MDESEVEVDMHIDSESPSSDKDYLRLRQLLLGNDYASALNRYIGGEDDAQRVSQVLLEALRLVEQQQLGESLAPVIDRAINASIEENPTRITDILFPIMGPAIRKAVASALAEMVQSLNTLLEQSLTLNSVKWRFSAWRAGMPYAKYVLLQTVQYRVEQVLLVHRETGLLLNSVTAAQVETQDPELVSSMLTAIADFVSDSFSAGKETLERIRFGDLELQLLVGPQAILAVAVRGSATDDLALAANKTIESVHAEFGRALLNFEGDRSAFDDSSRLLSRCLLSKEVEEEAQRKPWLALVLLFAAGLYLAMNSYNAWLLSQQMDSIVNSLRQEQGYMMVSTARSGEQLSVDLLRAPDSRTLDAFRKANLEHSNVELLTSDRVVHFGPLPEPAALPVVAPLSEMNQFVDQVNKIHNTRFYFEPNASELSELELNKLPVLLDDLNHLLKLANALSITDLQLMVMGFADSSGSKAKNDSVSQARANSVTSLLKENLEQGVDKADGGLNFIVAWGLGNRDNEGITEGTRRRVSLQLLYASPSLPSDPQAQVAPESPHE
jgi:outer membrane protein OmpA-like peptidoglycan-associated protein